MNICVCAVRGTPHLTAREGSSSDGPVLLKQVCYSRPRRWNATRIRGNKQDAIVSFRRQWHFPSISPGSFYASLSRCYPQSPVLFAEQDEQVREGSYAGAELCADLHCIICTCPSHAMPCHAMQERSISTPSRRLALSIERRAASRRIDCSPDLQAAEASFSACVRRCAGVRRTRRPFGSAEVGTAWRCDATILLVDRIHALMLGEAEGDTGCSAWVVYWFGVESWACVTDLRQQRGRIQRKNAGLLLLLPHMDR